MKQKLLLQHKLLQKLSPQQIQVIKLLEIPTLQLEQRIKKELEENPVLELESDSPQDEDNIEIAQELADAMGAVVSCSRPIVDAKWMEKSRQVGTSGQTVKPKVYLALGISGSFQHMGGLKGNPFIVAVNKNAKAPIMQVADVGVVDDLLEFVPVLTEKIQEGK